MAKVQGEALPDLNATQLRSAAPIDTAQLPPVETHELAAFLDEAATGLQAEYRRIRRRASEDPGTAGDEGEGNWQELLSAWLPGSFPVVTKGRILSENGRLSPQVDVLVLRSGYPRALINKKTYLAGGVLAAFECKLTLKPSHIREAAATSRAVKALVRMGSGTPYDEIYSPIVYGVLAHRTTLRKRPRETIDELLGEQLALDNHPSEMLDIVTVAGLGTWRSSTVILVPSMYNDKPELWKSTQALFGLNPEGGVSRHYMRARASQAGPWTPPEPLLELFEHLVHRLSWDHPEHRFLADYWVRAGKLSAGSVASRGWGLDFMSDEVRRGVTGGRLTNGERWGRWAMGH